jgi:hypothetical protein
MRGFRMRFQGRGGEGSYAQLFLAESAGSESMPSFKNERMRGSGWVVHMSFGSGSWISMCLYAPCYIRLSLMSICLCAPCCIMGSKI